MYLMSFMPNILQKSMCRRLTGSLSYEGFPAAKLVVNINNRRINRKYFLYPRQDPYSDQIEIAKRGVAVMTTGQLKNVSENHL